VKVYRSPDHSALELFQQPPRAPRDANDGVLALRISGFDFHDPFIGQTGIERLQPKRFGNPTLLREGI